MRTSAYIAVAAFLFNWLPAEASSSNFPSVGRESARKEFHTETHTPGYVSEARREVEKKLGANYICSAPNEKDYTEVSFAVADDGKIYEPEITHFTGNDQHDVECLEALCGLSPLEARPNSVNFLLEHLSMRFGKDQVNSYILPGYDGADIRQYLKDHPQVPKPSQAFVVIHKIPLFVLSRYPGLFTKEEILNPNNLTEVKVDAQYPVDQDGKRFIPPGYIFRVCKLYAYWTKTLKDRGEVTRATVLEHAARAEAFRG
jgi:hypothetical protein